MSAFNWYESPKSDTLEQGDIFFRFPVLIPGTLRVVEGNAEFETRSRIEFYDVIVLTQSCDLVEDEHLSIILCPVADFERAAADPDSTVRRNQFPDIRKGRMPSYHLLKPCDIQGHERGHMVINFSQVFVTTYRQLITTPPSHDGRLRLLPPYKEHLSQAFARFVMRVGLPQDVGDLPKHNQ